MGRGKLSTTQIQTAVFQSSDNLLLLSTINSITEYYSKGIINDNDFHDVFEGRGSGVNCAEYMMKYSNKNKYNLMLLTNDPFISSDPISEVPPTLYSKTISYPIDHFNKEEMESLMTNVRAGQSAKKIIRESNIHNGFCIDYP